MAEEVTTEEQIGDGGSASADTPSDHWSAAIEHEGARALASGFDSEKDFFDAIGYEANEGNGDWRAAIEDEKVRAFADHYASLPDLIKHAYGWHGKLRNGVVVPSKDATDEERAAYRKAIGVPDSPDGYKVKLDEEIFGADGAEPLVKGVLAILHEEDGTPRLAQRILDYYAEAAKKGAEAEEAALIQAQEESKANLLRRWGPDAEKNAQGSTEASREFGGEEYATFCANVIVDGVALGDHPVQMNAWANVGRMLGSAKPNIDVDDDKRASLQEEYDQIRAEQRKHINAGNTAAANRLDKRAMEISEQLVGAGPPVGVGGRTV